MIINPRYANQEHERAPETAKAPFCDEVSGLRYYNPAQGRWINRDPLDVQGGMNLFGFVDNSPADRVDPFGLKSIDFYFVWDSSNSTTDSQLIDRFKDYFTKKIDQCKALKAKIGRSGAPACCNGVKWDFSFSVTYHDLGIQNKVIPPIKENGIGNITWNDYDFQQMPGLAPLKMEFENMKKSAIDPLIVGAGSSVNPIPVILTMADITNPLNQPSIGYTLQQWQRNKKTGLLSVKQNWGILLGKNASGASFAHEFGHYAGYQPPASALGLDPIHSTDPKSLMFNAWDLNNNSGGENVDCEYCTALSSAAK